MHNINNINLSIMNFLKERIQILSEGLAHYEQIRINAENECLAMSCGAFGPRFLDKVKRNKVENSRIRKQNNNARVLNR